MVTSVIGVTPLSAHAQVPCHSIELSTVAMQRNASLFRAASDITSVAVDDVLDVAWPRLLTSDGNSSRVVRLTKLWIIDLPIVSLAQVANHEWGHATRITEAGARYSIRVDALPWPIPFASATITPASASIGNALGIVAGGIEASQVLADRIARDMYSSCHTIRYSDVALFLYAKLDPTAYSLTDLRNSHLATPDIFFSDPGDPRQYAAQLAYLRYGFAGDFTRVQDVARTIRTRSLLNVLDYALVGNARLLWTEYVIHGRRAFQPAKIRVGRVALVPRLKYGFSSFGPEYTVRAEYITGQYSGGMHVRWTERLVGRRLIGVGGDASRAVFGIKGRLTADLWKERTGTYGARVEGTVGTLKPKLNAWASIGIKSNGYLDGYPNRGTWYGAFACTAVF